MSAVSARASKKDPSQRVVITGMGVVSCFGNDVDTFYNRCATVTPLCCLLSFHILCAGGLGGVRRQSRGDSCAMKVPPQAAHRVATMHQCTAITRVHVRGVLAT